MMTSSINAGCRKMERHREGEVTGYDETQLTGE